MKHSIAFLLPFAMSLLISCNQQPAKTEMESYSFIHTVFFWLNDSITESDKKIFEAGLEELGKVPVIVKYDYGKPAGTQRDVVDNSYDYAWIVYFKDAEGQQIYQDHPIHQQFIEKHKHLWKSVKVFDTALK